MKIRIPLIKIFLALFCGLFVVACSDSDDVDRSGEEFGYMQLMLYKKTETRVYDELEYLNQAHKINLNLVYNNQPMNIPLLVDYYDEETSEFGVQTEKAQLLAGDYKLIGYTIYDKVDDPLMEGIPETEHIIRVEPTKLTVSELEIKVVNRGKVSFNLIKDMSEIESRADSRKEYRFADIKSVSIRLRNKNTGENMPALAAKTKLITGRGTTYIKVDTTFTIKAGEYELVEYTTYSNQKLSGMLEIRSTFDQPVEFILLDNDKQAIEVPVTLKESDEYIKDYMALKTIYEEMDGDNWYWNGTTYPIGSKWNFDKDIDLWGDQPGVMLHGNGRVAGLDLGKFGAVGDVPEILGQLTEITEIRFGQNIDTRTYDVDYERDVELFTFMKRQQYPDKSLLEIHKEELKNRIPVNSELNRTPVQGTARDSGTGTTEPGHSQHGILTNGIKSLPESINKLQKLTHLYIANGLIEELPSTFGELKNLTDLEIFNCSRMEKFPKVISELPILEALNISDNKQWTAQDIKDGLDDLFTNGASRLELQIIYSVFNSLEEIPASVANLEKIGMLDFSSNKISVVPAFTDNVRLVMLYLEENQITQVTDLGDLRDMEVLSLSNNKLTVVPNIFKKWKYETIETVLLDYNEISSFENGFRGISCETLDLTGNKFTEFPADIKESESSIDVLLIGGNEITKIPKDNIEGIHKFMTTIDLADNKLSELPDNFNASNFPYLTGINLSGNMFKDIPLGPISCASLTRLFVSEQRDANGNRCLTTIPPNVRNHPSLNTFKMNGNDIRRIEDSTVESFMRKLSHWNVSDNPNLYLEIPSDYCTGIGYIMEYERTQHITGCTELKTDAQEELNQ